MIHPNLEASANEAREFADSMNAIASVALPCPFCGVELYDGIVHLKDETPPVPRCWNCLSDMLDDGRPWTIEVRRWEFGISALVSAGRRSWPAIRAWLLGDAAK